MTDTRDTRILPERQSIGYGALWAIGAIILITTVYDVNRKIGIGLFILALMTMALVYVRNNKIEFTRPL